MTHMMIGIMVLTAAVLTGCDRPSANTTKAEQAATSAKTAADKSAADTKAAADAKITADLKAASDTKSAADAKIAADLKAAADTKAAADAKTAANSKTTTDAAAKVEADAKAAADANTLKATALLTQLQGQINDNKITLAEETLAQIDGMKTQLPAPLLGQIETARAALARKKSAGAQLP